MKKTPAAEQLVKKGVWTGGWEFEGLLGASAEICLAQGRDSGSP